MKTEVLTCECGDHAWFDLTRGYVTLIDAPLAAVFSCWKWHALIDNGNVYAARTQHAYDGDRRIDHKVYVHQVVLPLPSRLVVDHRDGNGLHNKRGNLRALTSNHNAHLQTKRPKCSSRYRGVSRRGVRWFAYINANGRQHSLGTYSCEADAAAAYNAAAQDRYGDQAYLNVIPPKTGEAA